MFAFQFGIGIGALAKSEHLCNTISGAPNIQKMYQNVEDLHGSVKNLPMSCTSKMEPSLCFFPQHVVPNVETPLFIFNSAYDSWQINNSLIPSDLDPQHVWDQCKNQINSCTFSQRTIIKDFGVEFMKAFGGGTPSSTRGYFITSCHIHQDIIWDKYWFDTSGPTIYNKTIAEAVGDWFFDRTGNHQHIDPYPFARDCY
ncbi:pectin acetylesterase 8-like [Solanum tuberosum]|nr:PREDICTED: pectin acetylesterase 8-like [Solanum tuberosum]